MSAKDLIQPYHLGKLEAAAEALAAGCPEPRGRQRCSGHSCYMFRGVSPKPHGLEPLYFHTDI